MNRNIRCIEIYLIRMNIFLERLLNRNIRCIEMALRLLHMLQSLVLNRNIRCIEINQIALAVALAVAVEPQHKMY